MLLYPGKYKSVLYHFENTFLQSFSMLTLGIRCAVALIFKHPIPLCRRPILSWQESVLATLQIFYCFAIWYWCSTCQVTRDNNNFLWRTNFEMCSSGKYPYPPPRKVFSIWTPNPTENSSLASYFRLKNCAFETPVLFGISITFLRVSTCMDIKNNLEMHNMF